MRVGSRLLLLAALFGALGVAPAQAAPFTPKPLFEKFSAPMVAGVAAHLLALHPDWTPDQVKGALMLAAARTSAHGGSLGVGALDARATLEIQSPPNPNLALSRFLTGDGFDGRRWMRSVRIDPSWDAASWSSASWSSASWSSAAWSSASWSSASWTSATWSSASWSTASWTSASWTSASWSSASWTSSLSENDGPAG